MTPKEKAQELFNKYFAVAESIEWTNKETSAKAEIMNDELGPDVLIYWNELAKKSALIAVDEILDVIPNEYLDVWQGETYMAINEDIAYWQEVKHEIEKL
jgi:hypothetical protein